MGIPGLISKLKIYTEDVHVRDLSGDSVAVDSTLWIYKGAYTCAKELAFGEATLRYKDYVMGLIMVLIRHGVNPIMVFDGASVPAKLETSQDRAMKRDDSLNKAKQFLSAGKDSAASSLLKKSVYVTRDMVNVIIEELRNRKIEYIVAPYEADSQIAFLCKENTVQGVFSDDADMVPLGCKRIYRDLDWQGNCKMLNCEKFASFTELSREKGNCGSLDMSGFDNEKILTMCLFSGCDYLKRMFNLRRSHALAKDNKTYLEAIEAAEADKIEPKEFPPGYRESFVRALNTFKYPVVYNPKTEKTVRLSQYEGSELEISYAGLLLRDDIAKEIALGNTDPYTGEPFRANTQQEHVAQQEHAEQDDAAEDEEVQPLGKLQQEGQSSWNTFLRSSRGKKRKSKLWKMVPRTRHCRDPP